jgi:TetR/AcrR family transcriptional regulator, cholesterol catabolism regulator
MASARTGRPTRPALRARYDRRREEVVEGAARVFARRGYAETSVAELAAELGLATGAIYHYFSGKQELLVEICDQLMEPLLTAARQLLERQLEPAAQLRALLRLWVAHVVGHRDHLLVFTQVRHVVDHGAEWREVRRSRKEFEELLAATLEAAAVADPDLARYALLGMVNHTVQWYRPRGRLGPEQIADGYVELVL